jgi:hypothetical protein
MNTNFEPVMAALFARLVAAATITFTATGTAASATLTAVSSTAGLFAGLPVFGPGVVAGCTLASVGSNTVTLSDPVSTGGAGEIFSTGFLTTGRRVIHWTQVAEQPALFLRRTGVHDEDQGDGLIMTTLDCEVWIYCNAGQNPDVAPDSVLTGLEQLIRTALQPGPADDEGRYTLAGLAYWCRIEGKSDISPGDQGPQAIARIPVRITLP